MKYDDSKIYFKICEDSETLFNIQTYSFNNLCLVNCPEENTIKNEEQKKCECKYNYYYDSQNELYNCLLDNEECQSKSEYKYKSPDGKICYKNNEECSGKKYLITYVMIHVLAILKK